MSSIETLKNEIANAISSSPIVYINHYHYSYIDEALNTVLEYQYVACDEKHVMEYDNGQGCVVDFKSKRKDDEYKMYSSARHILKTILDPGPRKEADAFADTPKILLEQKRIFLFKGLKTLNNDTDVSLLQTFALNYERGVYDNETTIIIVSPDSISEMLDSLKNIVTVINVMPPTTNEIKEYIEQQIECGGIVKPRQPQIVDEMVRTLQGMQMYDVKQTLRTVLALKNNRIDRSALRIALDEKKRIVKKSGIIEVVDSDICFDEIGGLQRLREDLEIKSNIYHNLGDAEKYKIPIPKGILIIGMPGCGKSMIAKAAANLFEVSLLRLDVSRLMGKFVGESEANLRLALATAEAAHPCVLWIDEIEKAFAGTNNNKGDNDMLVMRMMGHFLTWMQERKTPVYIIATANDVMRPEFMRKGRFDEVYFVNFPNLEERAEILRKKIEKKYKDSTLFDFSEIGDCKEVVKGMEGKYGGFSGSEIECVLNMVVEEKFSLFLNSLDMNGVKIRKEDFDRAINRIKDSVMANQESKKRDREEYLQDKTSIERIIDMKETYKFTDASK